MDFTTDNDADLLAYMAEDEADVSMAAWGEFFTRHREYLFGIVRKRYGQAVGGEQGAEDIVIETFQAAHAWAVRHATSGDVLDGFRAPTAEESRRRVRGWLGTIAENIFKDIHERNERESSELVRLADDARDTHAAPPPDPERLRSVRIALDTLRPEDRDVLFLSLPWYDFETETFNLGRGEAQQLANELGITVDAFRQRRHRALERLKKAMVGEPKAAHPQGARK